MSISCVYIATTVNHHHHEFIDYKNVCWSWVIFKVFGTKLNKTNFFVLQSNCTGSVHGLNFRISSFHSSIEERQQLVYKDLPRLLFVMKRTLFLWLTVVIIGVDLERLEPMDGVDEELEPIETEDEELGPIETGVSPELSVVGGALVVSI